MGRSVLASLMNRKSRLHLPWGSAASVLSLKFAYKILRLSRVFGLRFYAR